jgi:2-methylcitrate dehydratase PrpD
MAAATQATAQRLVRDALIKALANAGIEASAGSTSRTVELDMADAIRLLDL